MPGGGALGPGQPGSREVGEVTVGTWQDRGGRSLAWREHPARARDAGRARGLHGGAVAVCGSSPQQVPRSSVF